MKTYYYQTKPEPYQEIALRKALIKKRFGIFFEQRVGKTKVAIDYIGVNHLWNGYNKVLIICPLFVRLEWVEQLQQHMSKEIKNYNYVLYPNRGAEKETIEKLFYPIEDKSILKIILVNYDVLSKKEKVEDFVKWKPDIIIFDEAHLLRGHKSQRSKSAWRISRECGNVLGLTGTPIPKHPKDLFGLFRAIDPTVYGHTWSGFRDKYLILGGYMEKEVLKKIRNEKELTALMHLASIRVLRKDIMKEPLAENIMLPVELEAEARIIYKKLKNEYIAELKNGKKITADMAGVRARKLQQLCGGFLKDEEGIVHQISNAKLNILKDLINNHVIEGGQKIIIVVYYRHEIEAINLLIKSMKINSLIIHGGKTEIEKTEAKNLFQTNVDYPVLINQIQTGGMGVSFDAAHIMVFYSMSYIHGEYQQMRDRIMGRGQKAEEVTRYFLIVKNTIDEKIIKALIADEELALSISNWKTLLLEDNL